MTTTDLVYGRITSFGKDQRAGLITLDDGTQVRFTGVSCMMNPEEGAAVRVRLAPAVPGELPRAVHVEPALLDAARARPIEIKLSAVQREELAGGLNKSILEHLVARRFAGQPEAATLPELLDAYYADGPERARHDGYLRRRAGMPRESDDLLAELAVLLPDASLPRQVRWVGPGRAGAPRDPRDVETMPYEKAEAGDLDAQGHRALIVRDPDGRERTVEVASLDDVIEVANEALRRAGDARRVYKLHQNGAWQAYFVLPVDRARRLAATLPFAVPPADVP